MKMEVALVVGLLLIACMPLTAFSCGEIQSQLTPQMYIQPSKINATKLGEIFNVSVNIQNVYASERLIGFQFRIQYNKTLLKAIEAYEGPFLSQFPNRPEPPYTYFIKYIEDDPFYGPNVLIGIILLPDDTGHWTNFPNGSGTLATVTFQTIYRPVEPSPPLTCGLNLTDTMIIDDSINEISHRTESAIYSIQPLRPPKITVSNYTATLLGEIFNVSINVRDLDSDWRVVIVQFRLQYNPMLLDAIEAYEGPFLSQFPNRPEPPYTYFIKYIEDDPFYGPNVLIGIILLPDDTGHWTNFPNGSGTLATVTFKAKTQPSGGQKPVIQCLKLNDTMLINDTIGEVPYTTTFGIYQINPLTFTFEPVKPSAGEVVIFKVNEPETHATIQYTWNFGDGTIENTTEPIISHVYATPGKFNVSLTCTMDGAITSAWKIIDVGFYMPLDVKVDVGSIHFNGEIAQFYILVTQFGKPVDVTGLSAILYYDGTPCMDLSTKIQKVDRGLYIASFTIPGDFKPGTYTLLVAAEYYQVKGASIKSFLVSSTLSGFISGITGQIATITSGLNVLKLNLTTINAKLASLDGEVATISTTLGNLTTTTRNINLTVTEINGDVATISTTLGTLHGKVLAIEGNVTKIATIQTDLGIVKADVSDILKTTSSVSEKQGTLISLVTAAIILALLAAAASLFILLKIRKT